MLFKQLLALYLFVGQYTAPLWTWILKKRLKRGKETQQSIEQKLSLKMPERPTGTLVWGHAVGVGEAQALAGLFWALSERLPNVHFLITSSSNTSGQALQRTGLPPRCKHQFAPVDCNKTVEAFLRHWQPNMALFCEMDLWPITLKFTQQMGAPMLLLNARTTIQKVAHRKRFKGAYGRLLNGFNEIYTQNSESQEGLIQLGARSETVHVGGSIKVLAPVLACNRQQLHKFSALLENRPVWLLASSHPGEEAVALAAHALLLHTHPNALLLIAPRDPNRRAEIAAMMDNKPTLRSQNEWPTEHDTVYLADTIGEMGLWYRLAPVSLVGGSIVKIGGHNPYEPARLNSFVISGPHIWNFSETYADLVARRLAVLLSEPADIAGCVRRVWSENKSTPSAQDWVPEPTQRMLDAIVQWAKASS